jgi:hypothetical protein
VGQSQDKRTRQTGALLQSTPLSMHNPEGDRQSTPNEGSFREEADLFSVGQA